MEISDERYLEVLEVILRKLDNKGFSPKFFDDTTIGDKSTETNIGLCNPNFGVKHHLAFHHKCPFDTRPFGLKNWEEIEDLRGRNVFFLGYNSSCFYYCYIFSPKYRWNLEEAKKRVMEHINHLKGE